MEVNFFKYQGTGNDFVMLDNRAKEYKALTSDQIAYLCDRRFGVGADGLIMLEEENELLRMHYYNADGNLGSMCGNGGRCFVGFAHLLDLCKGSVQFMAFDGLHKANIISTSPMIVKLGMNEVTNFSLAASGSVDVDTGSPHQVIFVNDIGNVDVATEGSLIRYSAKYKAHGINVNFVEVKGDELMVRTYERGVEAETFSCGTGVVAAVTTAVLKAKISNSGITKVTTSGGELMVHYKKNNNAFSEIYLEGPTSLVFVGNIII
jgi:diaminopimelate epimerase